MTHDKYKAALDALQIVEEKTVYLSSINPSEFNTIRHALTIAAEYERVCKRLAELETLLEQSNNKIKWYERTEAKND